MTKTAWVGSVVRGISRSIIPEHWSSWTRTVGYQKLCLDDVRNPLETTGWPRGTRVSNRTNTGTSRTTLETDTKIRYSSTKETLVLSVIGMLPSVGGRSST